MQAENGGLRAGERAAWRGFVRTHALVSKELDAELERTHGLQLSSVEVLVELSEAEGRRMRMNELARAVSLSRSGLSRLIDRLAREHLIDREPCLDDARGSFAVLTDGGYRRLEEVNAAYADAIREHFLGHFDRDDLAQLAGYWERLLNGGASR
jgi:DNA-binding MarR family transcriptional regulator